MTHSPLFQDRVDGLLHGEGSGLEGGGAQGVLQETPTRMIEQGEDRGKLRLLFGAQVVRDGLAGALIGDDVKNDGGLDGLGAPGAW